MVVGGVRLELVGDDELIDHLVCLGCDDMLVVDLESFLLIIGVSGNSHDSHSCDVIGGVDAEILWLIVFFDNPIIDSSNCFHKIGQPSSIVRRTFIYKLVVDEGPNTLVLMHVRANVEVHKPLSLIRC
jgi:hypothetical protein